MLKQIWKRSLIKTLKKTISNQLLYNTLYYITYIK